ncbi:MAG: CpaF family protein [Myxococcota bacterium]|nr:CpaF family protein [Myxococcota bacterium]
MASLIEIKKKIRLQISQQFGSVRDSAELEQRVLREIEGALRPFRRQFNAAELNAVADGLYHDVFGYGPLQRLLDNPAVSEIMVNGPYKIFVEVDGIQHESEQTFDDEKHLIGTVQRIVRRAGARLDESQPTTECVLEGDVRIHAAIAPVAIDGPLLTIRKPRQDIREIEDLVGRQTLDQRLYQFLWACIKSRVSIIFSGATGSGKTTLLEVLSAHIDPQERLVVIEDVPELRLRQRNVARLCTRRANMEGKGEISLRELFVSSLRMRPTRIILGEIRGGEAFEFLQSLTSGHQGSLAVIHASSPSEVALRLENLVQFAQVQVAPEVIRQQISSGLDIVVQIERFPDGKRRISSISEAVGLQGDGLVAFRELFRFQFEGLNANGACIGRFIATGATPSFIDDFIRLGLNLPDDLFHPPPDLNARERVVGQSAEARPVRIPVPPPLP